MPAVSRHGYAAGQQIAKRLDGLGSLQSGCSGVSWWFIRVFLVAGGAWAMAAAQTGSFAYMNGSVADDFPMTSAERALLSGVVMLGAFLGAFFFGSLADAHGRKFSLLVAFALTHSAGALCAVSSSLEMLTLSRLVVGLGLGGQQPVICALIIELAPTNIRGRVMVYLDAFWPVGTICMVLLCREIEPFIGWRSVAALSASALLYLPLLYWSLPESPKWLATAGRFDEAVRVLRAIEKASSVFHNEAADDAITRNNQASRQQQQQGADTKTMIVQVRAPSLCMLIMTRVRILLRFPYLARTLMLWFVWTGLATSNSAMWDFLHEDFVAQAADSDAKTLLVYGVLVAQVLGNLSACALIDRIGRRFTIVSYLALQCVGLLLEVYLAEHTTLSMLLSSSLRNFAFFGAIGCLYTYTPELYPTSIRVIGIGYAWGISRIGALAGPYAVIAMEEHWDLSLTSVMWVFLGLVLSVAAAVLAFGIETAHYDAEHSGTSSSSVASRSSNDTMMPEDQDTSRSAVLAYERHVESKQVRVGVNSPIHFV